MNEAQMIELADMMETVMLEDAAAEAANDTLLREQIAEENAADEAAEAQERAEAASADWMDNRLLDPEFREEMLDIIGGF